MSMRRTEGVSIMQALAMTVAEIPVFLYSTFGQSIFSQLRLSPNLKKVLFATALGSVALALTAHHLKRRGRKRKQITQKKDAQKQQAVPESLLGNGRQSSVKRAPFSSRRVTSPSGRSNDTLSGISSIEPSKHSSSSHSLASMRVPSSPNQATNPTTPWEAEAVEEEPGAAEDSNAENLYIMGMELFEEALQKWELALNIRHRSRSDATTSNSLVPQGAQLEEKPEPESKNKVFAEKLETLLHRAYHLQEEFGTTILPDSLLPDFESEGTLILPNVEFAELREDDGASATSDDSFFSAAEATMLLVDETHQLFFSETGKHMIMGLMAKANKSPKAFLESYEEMVRYTQREDTWTTTKMELEGRGVVCMNFYDIALDFILMDAFEDLESPPSSVVAVLRNRWLSDSFKETALATACWSVLKAKRRLLMVPDGFISHFYSISEHVSPVLAFGFLGPKQHLSEVCNIFKQQIVQYLKDMFDHDKVRFTTTQFLADDILRLSRRRSEILLGYLGIESIAEPNGSVPLGNGPSEHN
ncbi:MIGA2 protein, partial [Amia calva]|nr:MIGA2 protein [Amia calva]